MITVNYSTRADESCLRERERAESRGFERTELHILNPLESRSGNLRGRFDHGKFVCELLNKFYTCGVKADFSDAILYRHAAQYTFSVGAGTKVADLQRLSYCLQSGGAGLPPLHLFTAGAGSVAVCMFKAEVTGAAG